MARIKGNFVATATDTYFVLDVSWQSRLKGFALPGRPHRNNARNSAGFVARVSLRDEEPACLLPNITEHAIRRHKGVLASGLSHWRVPNCSSAESSHECSSDYARLEYCFRQNSSSPQHDRYAAASSLTVSRHPLTRRTTVNCFLAHIPSLASLDDEPEEPRPRYRTPRRYFCFSYAPRSFPCGDTRRGLQVELKSKWGLNGDSASEVPKYASRWTVRRLSAGLVGCGF